MELLNSTRDDSIRRQFLDNFGHASPTNVQQALDVMHKLNVVDLFRQFETQQIRQIEKEIDEVEVKEVRPVLNQLVKAMHGRKL
jgi:geranylgeranyl pyrophosphate synthase